MLKSEIQNQFWITKKTVQRKLFSNKFKEDQHIISSDADLDAKIEVFKSISETSTELNKIIDQYQERVCILSQEECVFGRFLKEVGKRSKTTGLSITNAGKAVAYSGQQRMCVRLPLLRLQHEVEVFRCRAVLDTSATIKNMEKERTEYRAALSWMKSASSELDPDTGRGLDKFRTAQSHVRAAKQHFDSLSLDSVQKIDLLAAARCNMYSHALVQYMNELKQFAEKTANTFETISKALLLKPKYDFCVLKELTQDEGEETNPNEIEEIVTVDQDQSLFFADEYVDAQENEAHEHSEKKPDAEIEDKILIELTQKVEEIIKPIDSAPTTTNANSTNFWSKMFNHNHSLDNATSPLVPHVTNQHSLGPIDVHSSPEMTKLDKETAPNSKSTKSNPWLDLFAELDPLAHPEAFDLKLNGGRTNFQQT